MTSVLVRVAAVLSSLALAGCYSPSVAPCIYSCNGTACPSGLTCNADINMCVATASDTCHDVGEDAGTDAPFAADASSCAWPSLSNVDPCLIHADTTSDSWAVTTTVTVNTDNVTGFPSSVQPVPVTLLGGSTALAVPLEKFSVTAGGTLLVTGNTPLIIVAREAVTLSGPIRANGTVSRTCGLDLSGMDYAGAGASGGGGGGGFGAQGGDGGDARTDSLPPSDDPAGHGGAHGNTPGSDDLVPLRAGCPGGHGGGQNGTTGVPGASGGAIQISSKISITLASTISANGAGGSGSPVIHNGGSGGGSGGAILLEAPSVIYGGPASGKLCANGGGGGASAPSGSAGATATNCELAVGGAGTSDATPDNGKGGNGGQGITLAANAGDNGNSPSAVATPAYGGGGGGGGVGRIRVNANMIQGTVTTSPRPTIGTLPGS